MPMIPTFGPSESGAAQHVAWAQLIQSDIQFEHVRRCRVHPLFTHRLRAYVLFVGE